MSSDLQPVKDDGVAVSLTHLPLDINSVISDVRSPKAGAIVLFAGWSCQFLLSILPDSNSSNPYLTIRQEQRAILSMGSLSTICNIQLTRRELLGP